MNDNRIQLNGIKVHPFPSDSSLLEYVEEHKGILVAINAEKILHANEQIQNIVNRNIGYCDGIGAVMEKMYQAHPAIYQGLGGSFDVYTGNVKRAPEWWIKHNLEFAYRLLKQPSRIKRQIHLIKFLILVKTGKI